MELVPGAFVDEKLETGASDLLWRVGRRNGGEAYALVLWEHQTRPGRWIALRLLRYQVNAWTRILQDDSRNPKGNLPLICCVVLYQGGES